MIVSLVKGKYRWRFDCRTSLHGRGYVCLCIHAHMLHQMKQWLLLEQNTDCGLLKEFLISCGTRFLASILAKE